MSDSRLVIPLPAREPSKLERRRDHHAVKIEQDAHFPPPAPLAEKPHPLSATGARPWRGSGKLCFGHRLDPGCMGKLHRLPILA